MIKGWYGKTIPPTADGVQANSENVVVVAENVVTAAVSSSTFQEIKYNNGRKTARILRNGVSPTSETAIAR